MASVDDIESVLHKRLLCKETVFLGSSLNKVGSKFQEFVQSLEEKEGVENEEQINRAQTVCDAVIKELQLYSLEIKKGAIISQTYLTEIEEYQSQQARLEAESIRVQEEIETLKRELKQEKEIRARKEEYETLAKRINEHKPNTLMNQEKAVMEQKLEQLLKENSKMAEELDARTKQFSLMMACVKDLQAVFEEDKQDAEMDEMENEGTVDSMEVDTSAQNTYLGKTLAG